LSKVSDVLLSVHPGSPITYTVVASNSGSQTHTGVALEDLIPAGTAYVPGSLMVSRTPLS
jgi:large repetitive protein